MILAESVKGLLYNLVNVFSLRKHRDEKAEIRNKPNPSKFVTGSKRKAQSCSNLQFSYPYVLLLGGSQYHIRVVDLGNDCILEDSVLP